MINLSLIILTTKNMGMMKNLAIEQEFAQLMTQNPELDEIADSMDDEAIEDMDFDTPIKKEYKRQHQETSNGWCRHLKGLKDVSLIDHLNDEIVNVKVCNQCNKILDPGELKARENLINKFNNLNK